MTTMNISLPDHLREHVDQRVAAGDFGSSSEFIRDLIRKDRDHVAEQELAALIREGLESGPSVVVDDDYWAGKRARLNTASRQ